MRVLCLIFSLLLLLAYGDSFLWPSSFGGSTTTTTTTTHSGPPHPHAHGHAGVGGGITPMIGQPLSSHLHIRPASVGSYMVNRPLPPLVMGSHHHHHHRPIVGSTPHLHVHGGAIAGTGHRHHYHVHQQHHHHPHVSRTLHSHPYQVQLPRVLA